MMSYGSEYIGMSTHAVDHPFTVFSIMAVLAGIAIVILIRMKDKK